MSAPAAAAEGAGAGAFERGRATKLDVRRPATAEMSDETRTDEPGTIGAPAYKQSESRRI